MSIVPDHIIEALEELYATLPTMQCQGKCQTCCGPIDMSLAERMRIEERGVAIPPMSDARIQLWEDNHKFDPLTGEPLFCPALNLETGGCNVYDVRPMVCRLWGAAESMPCPHGCQPTKMLSDNEALALLMESMKIGGGGRGGAVEDNDEKLMQAAMADETLAPLMAAFIRGDRTVHEQVVVEMDRLRKELGL